MHINYLVRWVLLSFTVVTAQAFALEVERVPAKVVAMPISTSARMAEFNAETLAERRVQLPRDLPGARTLVLVTFEQAQKKNMDTWVDGLGLLKSPIPWAVTPVIEKQNAFVQAMISGGMRLGTSDARERDNTIPLFTSQKNFIAAMQLKSGEKTNYAVVVDRTGKVWAIAEGDYSAEKASPLLAAFSSAAESGGK